LLKLSTFFIHVRKYRNDKTCVISSRRDHFRLATIGEKINDSFLCEEKFAAHSLKK